MLAVWREEPDAGELLRASTVKVATVEQPLERTSKRRSTTMSLARLQTFYRIETG
jgi:hypothetical protein